MGNAAVSSIERMSALKGHQAEGVFGAADPAPGVALAALAPTAIAQINGAPQETALGTLLSIDASVAVNRVVLGASYDLLWNGPGKWLCVSDTVTADELVTGLRDRLAKTDVTVTDLSHARTVVKITGGCAVDVLCKGCPADIEAMGTGDCMATLIGTIGALVHCREQRHEFDTYVYRSLGQAYWEWLTDAALEYGFSVG